MIAYPTRAVPTNGFATVPIMHVFGYNDSKDVNQDFTPFQNAVNQGWVASWMDEVKPVDATCATGNCTFPDVRSFGICAAARDITDAGFLDTNFITNPRESDLSFPSNFAGSEFYRGANGIQYVPSRQPRNKLLVRDPRPFQRVHLQVSAQSVGRVSR